MCSHFLSSVFSLLSVVYIFHLNFPGILIKIIVFVCVNTSCLDYNTANFLKNHQYALKAQELFKNMFGSVFLSLTEWNIFLYHYVYPNITTKLLKVC